MSDIDLMAKVLVVGIVFMLGLFIGVEGTAHIASNAVMVGGIAVGCGGGDGSLHDGRILYGLTPCQMNEIREYLIEKYPCNVPECVQRASCANAPCTCK